MLPENEVLISLRDVPRLPRLAAMNGGRGVSAVSIYRWVSTGVGGVKLESVRVGGRIATSESAITRFLDKLNGVPAGSVSQSVRATEIDLAAAELRKQTARRRPRSLQN